MQIRLQNDAGQVKTPKIGFSWTVLFFGFFVPLFRGDAKWAIFMMIADVLTFWLANFLLCFLYNGIYVKDLLEKGYYPSDDYSLGVLRQKGWVA